MILYGIAKVVGSWVSASGYCLHIKTVREDLASVDFLGPAALPFSLPI
jgi:hypothetical protein